MKRFFLFCCTSIIIQFLISPLYGYDNKIAHKRINEVIVNEFMDRLHVYIQNYNEFKKFEQYHFGLNSTKLLGEEIITGGLKEIVNANTSHTAKEWIIHGGYSADEPELPAAFRHFYDPTASVDGKHYLTNISIDPGVMNPAIDAIFWHFEGRDNIDGNNNWTWDIGKSYLVIALNSQDITTKNNLLALAMRCLGEVLHNTADMGLPAHVRNDAHGGYNGVGGADPYESLFDPNWISKFAKQPADPEYTILFGKAKLAKIVNIKMAEFTNKNFFSQETISSNGPTPFKNLTMEPDFISPKLDIDFTYNSVDKGYYKSFRSGRTVLMCIVESTLDNDLDNKAIRPVVTKACVESQASELVPDIIEAGINVIRLFIPNLSVTLDIENETGKFVGKIKHTLDNEYTSEIKYCGAVTLFINNKPVKKYFQAIAGEFNGELDGLKSDDMVKAEIDFADIRISSSEYKVGDLPEPVITEISPQKGGLNTTVTLTGTNFSDYGELYFNEKVTYSSSWSDTEIKFVVPNSSTSGINKVYISVGGLKSNIVDFEVLPTISTLTITPSNSIIPIGGTIQLEAIVKDANGNQITDRTIEWSTTSSIITVSNTGLVSGLETGKTASVIARCEGKSAYASVCVVSPTNLFNSTGVVSSYDYSIGYSIEGLSIDESSSNGRELKGFPIGSTVTVNFNFSGRYSIEGSWDTQYRITVNGSEVDVGRAPDKGGELGWTHTGKPATIQITEDIVKNGFSINASIMTKRADGGVYLPMVVKGKGCK